MGWQLWGAPTCFLCYQGRAPFLACDILGDSGRQRVTIKWMCNNLRRWLTAVDVPTEPAHSRCSLLSVTLQLEVIMWQGSSSSQWDVYEVGLPEVLHSWWIHRLSWYMSLPFTKSLFLPHSYGWQTWGLKRGRSSHLVHNPKELKYRGGVGQTQLPTHVFLLHEGKSPVRIWPSCQMLCYLQQTSLLTKIPTHGSHATSWHRRREDTTEKNFHCFNLEVIAIRKSPLSSSVETLGQMKRTCKFSGQKLIKCLATVQFWFHD